MPSLQARWPYSIESTFTQGLTNSGILVILTRVCKCNLSVLVVETISYRLELTFCRFVEGYITIMVSCAPAMSSFWANTITKSALYSSLRSGLFSWSTRRTSSKGTNDTSLIKAEKQTPHSGSSLSNSKDSKGYYELREVPATDSPPLGHNPSGEREFIRKSTTITQVTKVRT